MNFRLFSRLIVTGTIARLTGVVVFHVASQVSYFERVVDDGLLVVVIIAEGPEAVGQGQCDQPKTVGKFAPEYRIKSA